MNNKYFLAVETNNNSYCLINTSDLETSDGKNYHDLAYLDTFTSNYTKETLAQLIAKSNVVDLPSEEIKNKVWVITSQKVKNRYKNRKLPVLTKEISDCDIVEQIANILKDKERTNHLYNLLIKYANIENNDYTNKIKQDLNNQDINSLFEFINKLDYLNKRYIYFFITNDAMKNRIDNSKKLNLIA